jgi:hypothetical protein
LKKLLLLLSFFLVSFLFGQKKKEYIQSFANNVYFTFNPLGIAELLSTVGAGIHKPLNNQIAFFTEIATVFKNPFYKNPDDIKLGFRNITQFRYYSKTRKRSTSFIALEARVKYYSFNNVRTFINETIGDTLKYLNHTAAALSVGGGIVFGTAFQISKNEKWQMELTGGIGVKNKTVFFRNVNNNYKPEYALGGSGMRIPAIDEAGGMPYLPLAMRIRYRIP